MTKPTGNQASLLRNNGLKVTLPRIKVLEIFENSKKRHLTAEEVFMELLVNDAEIGLATVYRILMQFVEAGMLDKSSFDSGKAVFELNEGHHHDHLVCVRCGKVEEFFDEEIEARQKEIAVRHGFKLLDHAMSLYGLCSSPECQASNAPGGKRDY
jgi:Fur family transcriptional regulator, ferric uptake regulator